MTLNQKHSLNSVFRERVIEHVFVGEVMKFFWSRDQMDVEVLRPEFDRGGYDVVITKGSVSRFIQLKTTLINSKTKDFKVSLSLSQKPNPCVIWILVDDNLDFLGFRWFGSDVGKNFPDISAKRLAKHTKGDASGQKAIRTGHRVLRPIDFVKLTTIEEVVEKLFQ